MLYDVVYAKVTGPHSIHLRFEDGTEGKLDLSKHLEFEGILKPLEDPVYFMKAFLDEELGTVCWPNGADLSPTFLYQALAEQAA